MIAITSVASDDRAFGRHLQSLVERAISRYSPETVYIIRIRDWFGPRWLRFSGKALGAVGVRKDRLTVPPFVPARVTSQLVFRREGQSFVADPAAKPLHLKQQSSQNLQRWVDTLGKNVALFWYSSTDAGADRASVMAYLPAGADHDAWYIGFKRVGGWQVAQSKGIARHELSELVRGGVATVA
jgi:hypothetical protein